MSIFSWFQKKTDTDNKTKQQPNRPAPNYQAENLTVNRELTEGLYHNTFNGMKLAGALAFTPIALPIWFMGVPTPIPENDADQEMLSAIVEQMYRRMIQLHLQCHREGTIWIFPKYSVKKMALVWEFIPDDFVVDIIKDLETGEPIMIVTDEQIELKVGENLIGNVRRKRIYTKQKIEIHYLAGSASVPAALKDKTYRNVVGVLPIAFSNNADGDKVRGHSDYERILSDLKDYHDINLKQSTVLAKFEAKLKITTKDVDAFIANNGGGSLTSFSVFDRDLIFCVDGEDATYEYPTNAYEAYESALKRIFRKLVEGSGMPEILWGTKTEGNHASAEEQMNNVVKFVEDKRDQKNEAYTTLFNASLALLSTATMNVNAPRIKEITWNTLDALSDETKAKIIKDFAQGVAYLIDKAGITKSMLFKLWEKMFPGTPPEKEEEFIRGLADMAKHRQFVNTDYEIGADLTGDPNADIGEPVPPAE